VRDRERQRKSERERWRKRKKGREKVSKRNRERMGERERESESGHLQKKSREPLFPRVLWPRSRRRKCLCEKESCGNTTLKPADPMAAPKINWKKTITKKGLRVLLQTDGVELK
jgi:hypothetical protein